MRNKRVFSFFLLFFISVCFMELGRGQNNKRTEVNVVAVTDVRTTYSKVDMLCVNSSLSDFYSSRPQFQTRLVVNVGDSRNEVVEAAAAGPLLISSLSFRAITYDVSYDFIPFEKLNGQATGNYNDLGHQVFLGRYDVVVRDITILANRSSYIDFTFSFIKSGVGLIVSMDDLVRGDQFRFLKPLSLKLWLTSFVCFLIVGFTVWVLENIVNVSPTRYRASTIFVGDGFSTFHKAPHHKLRSANFRKERQHGKRQHGKRSRQ
ncbi:hypothetical protein BRARA_D01492 [Brassica rapa]|uniref:Ionotropic glutamate receptor C-terminal domain-containing protein n=1 Tax=Brassica campestris TaxID=3711 RepID=A0A397ZUE2_BRACM|nr:glutamate receptor 2.2-like [Brassica rapa]RID66343.1 hypothetical protein BRARA_D01492 [Brassica rapa]